MVYEPFQVSVVGGYSQVTMSLAHGLADIIKSYSTSVIFTFETYSLLSLQANLIARDLRIRHLVVSYETTAPEVGLWHLVPWTRLVSSIVCRHANEHIVFTRRSYNALAGRTKGNIKLVPPALAKQTYLERFTKSEESPLKIGFMGALARNKGLDILIRAFRLFEIKNKIGAQLLIAGRGPLQPLVEREAEVSSSVKFLGFLSGQAKSDFLRDIDLFIQPSVTAWFGRRIRWEEQVCATVIEAMAAGLPVLASRCGSLPEIVGDPDQIVDDTSPQGLARSITRCTLDREWLLKTGERNRSRVLKVFNVEAAESTLSSVIYA